MWSRRRFTLGLGVAVAAPAVAQFRVEISGVGVTQMPVAVSSFRGEGAPPTAISAVIRADLERSGLFRMVSAPAGQDELSRLPQTELKASGAQAWLSGSAVRLADGSFDLRYRLWDVTTGEPLLGRAVGAVAADLRLAAHRIADEVYERLTGDRGVFSTRIAYVTRSGNTHALHITDADGEGGQIALRSAEAIISPAWSPDGKSLAYVSFESQKAAIWVQEVASGRRSMVANFPGSNSAPAWSPDGRELAVTLSRGGPAQLHLMPAAGGPPRRLTTSAAIDTEPTFSPDGRWIYFVSDRGGGPQIYRVAAAAGNPERVTFAGRYNISPALSPDGRTMAYVARQDNVFRVHVMDLSSGVTTPITDSSDDESPSFAPNSRLLVYATRSQGRDVLMTSTLDGRIKTRLLASGADMREPAWGPFGR